MNWYGLRDADLNWFDCIKGGLINHGFKQSVINSCLFTCSSSIMIIYVDDIIIATETESQITNLLTSLKDGTNIDTR